LLTGNGRILEQLSHPHPTSKAPKGQKVSQEINVTAVITVYRPSVMTSPISRGRQGSLYNMTGNPFIIGNVSVGTSATAIPLGSVTAPHWAWFYNTDPNNFLTIRNGSGGADLLKLLAGEEAVCPILDSSVPYAVANTLACILEYAIFSL
jgi:hypothetical protein